MVEIGVVNLGKQSRSQASKSISRSVIGASLLVFAGCLTTLIPPNRDRLYDPVAADRYPERRPLIVVPGFLETKLVDSDSGSVVWGAVGGRSADPETEEGARLFALSLRQTDLPPRITPDGVLDSYRFRGLSLWLKSYHKSLRTLGKAGYRDEELGRSVEFANGSPNSFQFAYDWRLDNVDNARRLHEFILDKAARCRNDRRLRGLPTDNVRFDIISHSMGGLLVRYYLRYGSQPLPDDGSLPKLTWAGAHHIERAILVAPPNGGALKAALDLINGVRHAPGMPFYDSVLSGTLASAYQMFPRARHGAIVDASDRSLHLDLLDPGLWQRAGWGLAAEDKDELLGWLLPEVDSAGERRRLARVYQQRMLRQAGQFQRSLDLPASPPSGTELFLLAGTSIETPTVLAVDPDSGTVEVVALGPGDGRVTMANAAMLDQRGVLPRTEVASPVSWQETAVIPGKHGRMVGSRAFSDYVTQWLLESERVASR